MLVTLVQVGPAQQGLAVDSIQAQVEEHIQALVAGLTRGQVEVPIRGQVVAHQLDLEVGFTQVLVGAHQRDLGEVHTQAQVEAQAQALAVVAIPVLVGVVRTGGIDLTQIADEI